MINIIKRVIKFIFISKENKAIIKSFNDHQTKIGSTTYCDDIITLTGQILMTPEELRYALEEWIWNRRYR